MKIRKIIELEIRKKNKKLYIKGLPTLTLVMGSTSVSGNLHYYGVKKEGNTFVVSIEVLKQRINVLEERIRKAQDSLTIMKQVTR